MIHAHGRARGRPAPPSPYLVSHPEEGRRQLAACKELMLRGLTRGAASLARRLVDSQDSLRAAWVPSRDYYGYF